MKLRTYTIRIVRHQRNYEEVIRSYMIPTFMVNRTDTVNMALFLRRINNSLKPYQSQFSQKGKKA